MKKRAVMWASAALTAALLAIGAGIAQATPAAPMANATDAQLVTPAQTTARGAFFSQDQIPEVWKEVVQNYPDPLPSGYNFPASPPAYFAPTSPAPSFFESGTVDNYAALYWRCAWLGASDDATTRGDKSAASVAANHLARFKTLPSVSKDFNLDEYNGMVTSTAKSRGISAVKAERQLQCTGIFGGTGAAR